MSRLLLVRHGQANAGSADYDRLSDLGWRQARELGRYWARLDRAPERVFVGPCRRHRETAAAAAEAFAAEAGGAWPEPEELAELDEHDGYQVFTRSLPALAEEEAEARAALELVDQPLGDESMRLYYRVYRRATERWARGDLELPGGEPPLEDWPRFRSRAEQAVERLTDGHAGSGSTVLGFTSAGPVAVAVGQALGLDHEAVMNLSWRVRNCAVSEFLFSGERFSLHSFNSQLHLSEPGLESWV